MLMEKAREELVKYGKKLVTAGLTKGTGGNLSVFDRENKMVAITPSGIDFFEIQPEDIVIIDLDGKIIEGTRQYCCVHNMCMDNCIYVIPCPIRHKVHFPF